MVNSNATRAPEALIKAAGDRLAVFNKEIFPTAKTG
jgi:hypothetical protein